MTLAAPLYPVGWPLLLSLPYRLEGDAALFWTLPVMALLSAGLAVARPQYWAAGDFGMFLATMRSAGRSVVTLGTPSYPLDFVGDYQPEPTGTRLARPPDGSDGIVHRIPKGCLAPRM